MNKKFLTMFVGMSVAGAALIWSIPPLFGPHDTYQVWITAVLGCLFLALAVGVLYLRPARPRSTKPDTDE